MTIPSFECVDAGGGSIVIQYEHDSGIAIENVESAHRTYSVRRITDKHSRPLPASLWDEVYDLLQELKFDARRQQAMIALFFFVAGFLQGTEHPQEQRP